MEFPVIPPPKSSIAVGSTPSIASTHNSPVIQNAGAINEVLIKFGDKSTILPNGETVPFAQAINELMAIFQHDEAKMTKGIGEFVTSGNVTEIDKQLHAWSVKYHHNQLQPAPGERFSTSVVRNGLLEVMRDFDQKGLFKSEMDLVLLAYFETHNARVISERNGHGSIPAWSFVNTNLAVRCLQALKNSAHPLSQQAEAFMGLKDSSPELQLTYAQLQQEIQVTALNNVIAHQAQQLANQKLSLTHIENEETGADGLVNNEKHLIETAASFIVNNISLSLMKNSIEELTLALSSFDTQLSILNGQIGDKSQFLLIKWDASEYLGIIRLAIDVALKTIEQLDQSEYETVSGTFNNRLQGMPHVQDILERNQTGNYPGEERNQLLAQVPELNRLFRQSEFKLNS